MISRRAFVLVALLALFSGCAEDSVRQVLAPRLPEGMEDVAEAVAFAQSFATMPGDLQRREVAGLADSFARNHDNLSRLRLALALGTPGSPVEDNVRAVALLEPLAEQSGKSPLRQFAATLQSQIAARVKEKRRADSLKSEADTARAQADAAKSQVDAARTELQAARGQAENARREAELQRGQAEAARVQSEALRQQLDALKAVERTMIERGNPPPPARNNK